MDLNQQILDVVKKLEPDHKTRVLNFAKYIFSEYYLAPEKNINSEDSIEHGFVEAGQIDWDRIDQCRL